MSDNTRIRWYHWMVYRAYHKLWSPILAARPEIVQAHVDWMTRWLDDIKYRADRKESRE